MEFCECGSLKIGGSCTNKKCSKNVKRYESISSAQISSIKDLFEKLEKDFNESTVKNMNSDDAQRLIEDLEDELEEIKRSKDEDSEDIEFEEIELDEDEYDK